MNTDTLPLVALGSDSSRKIRNGLEVEPTPEPYSPILWSEWDAEVHAMEMDLAECIRNARESGNGHRLAVLSQYPGVFDSMRRTVSASDIRSTDGHPVMETAIRFARSITQDLKDHGYLD